MIHRLTYNPATDGDDERLFQVRTRRIITTSMSIASGSNLIISSIGGAVGGLTGNGKILKKSLQKIDIGGLLVTIHHVFDDKEFIQKLKCEYVYDIFDKKIDSDE